MTQTTAVCLLLAGERKTKNQTPNKKATQSARRQHHLLLFSFWGFPCQPCAVTLGPDMTQRVSSFDFHLDFPVIRLLSTHWHETQDLTKIKLRERETLTGGVEAALTTKEALRVDWRGLLAPNRCRADSTEDVREDETSACAAISFPLSLSRNNHDTDPMRPRRLRKERDDKERNCPELRS